MKILMSPSKTQDFKRTFDFPNQIPLFKTQAEQLIYSLKSYSKTEISHLMNIKGKLLDETFEHIQGFKDLSENHAISSFIGLVFKQLHLKDYTKEQLSYMNNHLIILSGLYGILRPFDLIKPYRLDLNMKLKINLYEFYHSLINEELSNDQIINLASTEYSQIISHPMITIDFLTYKNDSFKNLGTYAKIERGKMVDFMIKNQIKSIDDLKQFNEDGFTYNTNLSNEKKLVFTKK